MRHWLAGVLAALAATTIAGAQDAAPKPVPMIVGGEPDYDACGAVGEVRGLNPQGDGFLAVRSGPGTDYPQISALYERNLVVLCARIGDWVGVAFPEEGNPDQDCGLGSPISEPRAYVGPCNWGWAHQNWITLIAG